MTSGLGSRFDGQVAVVTGGVQGIGAGIAGHLASCGASVAIVDLNAVAGGEAERRFKSSGLPVRFWACDLSEPGQISSVVDKLWKAEGRIDVLVNNAVDHGPRAGMLDYALSDWERVIQVNLTGTFWLTREVVKRMVKAQIAGNIVNVLAIQSEVPIAGYGAYVASKGGLEALTRAMAVEFATHGIRANGVMLGAIYSGSTKGGAPSNAGSAIDFESVPTDLDKSIPNLARRMGRPSDVANVVALLAAPASSYLTGTVVVVDGGRLLNRGTDPFGPKPAETSG